ncbi:DUF2478 domain-containing protein [Jannaschia rubra]|uniref:ABC-type molybdate transport system, ATPase component n=1 Tax=Jannaschia rubra TaxID=282197 RepID=A0A0M6XVL8_9RHOB|nr:DUF2478 domain-containing protein [Jannaschia rubra]CTQ34762.1 ABC-type molybdate transport system, ATPase component [Jannaschia rubra]SFG70326.1 Protein of unknown function [Jannaschia rubra]
MTAPLAAVRFDAGDIDAFLTLVAGDARARGLRPRGVVQARGGDGRCADMDLATLGSGRVFRISQPLGQGSRGCRLEPGGLARCSAFLEAEIARGADLLILNRFGRGEATGRGFRDLIGTALTLGVPVLTAVRPTYAADWAEFSAGLGRDLPMRRDAVSDWLARQRPRAQAA